MTTFYGKPVFPLSVRREFKFRACINSTGEMLETDSFKSLYRFARRHMRGETRNNLKPGEYRYMDATLLFGYETSYEIKPGYFYGEWTTIHDYGCLQISSISEWFYNPEDESNHCINGEGNRNETAL